MGRARGTGGNFVARHKNIIFILVTIIVSTIHQFLIGPTYAQTKKKPSLIQETRKDPFSLPSGVRLLSKEVPVTQEDKKLQPITEIKPVETQPAEIPLKLKAILIGDHVRLASIDRSIVTIGDLIHGEKVLEIKPDRVILEKEGKRRTLLLDKSPIKITVEDK